MSTRTQAPRQIDPEQWFEMRAAFGSEADDIIDVTTGQRYNLKTGMIEAPKRRRPAAFDLAVSINGGPVRRTRYQTRSEAKAQAASLKRVLGNRVTAEVEEVRA